MNKKVLVVDDEIHIVHVVAIKLRNSGYDVITAENGSEGWDLVCQEKPDIVITDYQMPVMTGLEMVEKMRENHETKNIPVIMLTARNFDINDQLQKKLSISECIGKPFSPKQILRVIEDILHVGMTVGN